jgi:hypothetical protein
VDYVGGDDDHNNLDEFYDNPVLLMELRNGIVVSPEFRHGIVRRGHVQQYAHGGRSIRTRKP